MKDFFQVLKMFCYVHREASDMLSLPPPTPTSQITFDDCEHRNSQFLVSHWEAVSLLDINYLRAFVTQGPENCNQVGRSSQTLKFKCLVK